MVCRHCLGHGSHSWPSAAGLLLGAFFDSSCEEPDQLAVDPAETEGHTETPNPGPGVRQTSVTRGRVRGSEKCPDTPERLEFAKGCHGQAEIQDRADPPMSRGTAPQASSLPSWVRSSEPSLEEHSERQEMQSGRRGAPPSTTSTACEPGAWRSAGAPGPTPDPSRASSPRYE